MNKPPDKTQPRSTSEGSRCPRDREFRQWVSRIKRKVEAPAEACRGLSDIPDLHRLMEIVDNGSPNDRKRALLILARLRGISIRTIARVLRCSRRFVTKQWDSYEQQGLQALHQSKKRVRKADDAILQEAVLALLHSRPFDFGIERASWRMSDLKSCFAQKGLHV